MPKNQNQRSNKRKKATYEQHRNKKKKKLEKFPPPICPIHLKPAKMIKAKTFLQNRWLDDKTKKEKNQNVWVCQEFPECHRAVFAEPGGTRPLGTLANNRTRFLRHQLHLVHNRLWREPGKGFQSCGYSWREARNRAYLWLANEMGLTRDECHFGLFTEEQCLKGIEITQKKLGSEQPPTPESENEIQPVAD